MVQRTIKKEIKAGVETIKVELNSGEKKQEVNQIQDVDPLQLLTYCSVLDS